MRKKSEILHEIEAISKSIGVDSFECAVLNTKIQQINSRIQGSIARMDQLHQEKFVDEVPVVQEAELVG